MGGLGGGLRKAFDLKEFEGREAKRDMKYGPGPVMVNDTLCPAVHISGT